MIPPSISVVIPAYNASQTICVALDSVCKQTLLPVEIIVVDDVSSDDTCAIVQQYIDSVATTCGIRITLLQQTTNSGPASARNAGIAASSSEWIAFLDGDDQWLQHKLEVQLLVLQANPTVSLICSPTLPLDGDHAPKCSTVQSRVPLDRSRATLLTLENFIYTNPVATSTVLVKREALQKTGGFDEQFRGPEDYDLWLRIVASHEVMKTTEPLSLYRHVPGSLSMDDRTFLPQVLAVLKKAFAPGGALEPYAGQRRRAYAEKYSSASWMAFNRDARPVALRHLVKSYLTYAWKILPEERDPFLRIKLLLLYLGVRPRTKEV
jgi:glycosyltransferase involved in cell wall biosynthesis